MLENAKNILIFLRFAKFYKQFVKRFSQIIAFFTNFIKNAKKNKLNNCSCELKKQNKFSKIFEIFLQMRSC